MRFRIVTVLLLAWTAGCEEPTAPVQFIYADRPVAISDSSQGWRGVSVGGSHSCGIRSDDTLYCWGSDASGQLGVGTSRGKCGRRRIPCEAGPRAVATDVRFQSVSAGQRHTCGISRERALYCWGENLQFQTAAQGPVQLPTPARVLPGLAFTSVSAGSTHTCAVQTNGVVHCWGEGAFGALGRGDTATSVLPAPIASAERFTAVSTGRLRSCGIALDGSAWCWGLEWESASGNIDYYHQRLLPHRIEGLPPLRDISVSTTSICAVSVEGVAFCWEANGFAQLGLGTTTGTTVPSPVASDVRFTGVSMGVVQGCATARDGRAFCWGNNTFGQLGIPRPGDACGDAQLECSRIPALVFGRQLFTSVATGFGNHSCGVTVETAIVCWGLGTDGQLGDGWLRDRQSLPAGVLAPSP